MGNDFADEELASQLGAAPSEIAKVVCKNASYVLANSAINLANYPCGEQGGYLHYGIASTILEWVSTATTV